MPVVARGPARERARSGTHGPASAPAPASGLASVPVVARGRGQARSGARGPGSVPVGARGPGSVPVGARGPARARGGALGPARVPALALVPASVPAAPVPGWALAAGAGLRPAGRTGVAEAVGARAGRGRRGGCRPRALRSGGAARWPNAGPSFRPHPGARRRRRARRHALRAMTGANTSCRSRRPCARSPSARTSRRCLRSGPRRPRPPPPAFRPPPECRCPGAVQRHTGRIRCGTE